MNDCGLKIKDCTFNTNPYSVSIWARVHLGVGGHTPNMLKLKSDNRLRSELKGEPSFGRREGGQCAYVSVCVCVCVCVYVYVHVCVCECACMLGCV